MDSQVVAEKAGSNVQLTLPSHEHHCPDAPSVGSFLFKSSLEVKGMEGTPSHHF
jgi:hypothetical protein